MTAVFVGSFEVESPEWNAARAAGLGGSEIAAVLGLGKWDSHYSLWARKAGNIGEKFRNDEMDAGRRLEPVILNWWGEQHPESHIATGGTYRSSERPWQVANPDGIVWPYLPDSPDRPVVPVAIVEAKFALYDYEWGTPGTDQIPPYYLTQCRWYLDVFDLDLCYLPVFIGSQGEFREYVIRQDDDDRQLMRDAGQSFMDSLEAGERPDIDDHSATYEAIREEHPRIDRTLEVAVPADLIDAYETTRTAADLATRSHRRVKAIILDHLGDARLGLVGDQPVLRRQPGPGGSIALHQVRKSA